MISVSFSELSDPDKASEIVLKDNLIVRIRGFLYSADGDNYVLADRPNLRSCCIGKKAKMNNQISVNGLQLHSLPSSALTLEGVLKVHTGDDNNSIPLYSLEQARIISEAGFSLFGKCILFLTVLLFVYAGCRSIYRLCRSDKPH